jgi:hypothetical protein
MNDCRDGPGEWTEPNGSKTTLNYRQGIEVEQQSPKKLYN